MFLKRTLVLAVGVLFFLVGFICYFEWLDAKMEDRFRQERQNYGVPPDVSLTTPTASLPAPAPSAATTPAVSPDAVTTSNATTTPVPADTATTPASAAPAAANSTDTSVPSPGSMSDTNIIIGPVPPPSLPTPDNSTTPAAPNTNSPPVPPSSTMLYPGLKHLGLLMMAASMPGTPRIQMQPSDPITITIPAPAPAPATNPAPAPAPTPAATNAPAAVVPATNTPVATALVTNAAPVSTSTNAAPAATTVAPSAPALSHPVAVESSVIVLLYHQFVPAGVHIPPAHQWTMNQDVFETEMKYIHDNGYHVIPMSDLLRFLRHEIGLPPNSVVITIDDGYKSAIVYAAPILKKYGFPWTYFVYPDFITVNEGSGAASWKDLLELQAEGVDVESHSMTHPNLPSHHQKIKGVWHNFTPEEYDQWLTNETLGAKTLLEQKLGKPIVCFAYPYGAYNKEVEAKVIAAGYQAIFTVADNPVRSSTSMYSIGRYTITQSVIKDFYAYLRQGALGLADIDPAPGATISNPRPVITAVLGYAGTLDPKSIETSVRDFGDVRHDFDPATSTLRLYLPRDLVQTRNLVNIRVRDAQTGQIMVANWFFNYEPAPSAAPHPPIGKSTSTTNPAPAAVTNAIPATAPATNTTPAVSASPTTPVKEGTSSVTNQAYPPKAEITH